MDAGLNCRRIDTVGGNLCADGKGAEQIFDQSDGCKHRLPHYERGLIFTASNWEAC